MSRYASLLPGDPLPWFRQRCAPAGADYAIETAAGRHLVLFAFASGAAPAVAVALDAVHARSDLLDGRRAGFFAVSADPADAARLPESRPVLRCFLDADGAVGRILGARCLDGIGAPRDLWLVLDPFLRVRAVALDAPGMAAEVLGFLERELAAAETADGTAPVLLLPGVFEPEFCARLLEHYARDGGRPSAVFTAAADGGTRAVLDPAAKRRRDCDLRDPALRAQVQARIVRRVVPEIRKAFQFDATEMERLILSEYSAADRGHFGAHRDNTVSATAHRRFAVSINLNDDFDGGELVFPEFGARRYRPPAGGALVFSCSLLHAVTPVTAGRRVACLPFVHDAAAAALKRAAAIAAAG
ncbi:MAG: 2OG-Fe(II) oxygenase [Gluconacetobacter diazotrophicus]|nr:2OG-Fe(II) oxygenase [Gluconacetobacter diazotrophicus]